MYGLKKFEGGNMKTKFLLLLLLPLCSTAPREIAGEDKKVDPKADHVGTHSHEDQRGAKMFSNNQVDLGNIIVSGSATGDDILIGHQLEIDVLGHTHEQDGHTHEQDGHAHEQDGHAHEQDGHAHRYVGHTQDHHEQRIYNAITKKNMIAIRALKKTIETTEDALKKIANGRHRRDVTGAGGFNSYNPYNMLSDEGTLHDLIHYTIYIVESCAIDDRICNAEHIESFSELIKSTFKTIQETGTVSLWLLEHFARLRGQTFAAIQILEKAFSRELDALLRAMQPGCGSIEFCTCNNGKTCDRTDLICCVQGNYPMQCTCKDGSIFTPYCGGERPDTCTCEDGKECGGSIDCCSGSEPKWPTKCTCPDGTKFPLITPTGVWSNWKEITRCSATCGPATKTIMRTCKTQGQGYECKGSRLGLVSCGLPDCPLSCDQPDCPIDGGWSDWVEVSQCSATCGPETKLIKRTCTNPEPANGGTDCSGSSYGSLDCDHDDCDVQG